MKKPTPDELARLRAAYPKGAPRIEYRIAALQTVRAVEDDESTDDEEEREEEETEDEEERADSADDETEETAAEEADEEEQDDEERSLAKAPIGVAISSEQKVLRYDWWEDERYYEVLDHSRSSIDTSYSEDGLPFVSSHRSWDADSQYGIVENVRVASDRVLRGDIRMSRSQRGQEIAQDLRDGIRKKVSVGYIVGEEYTQEKGGPDGIPVRRYTSWMPIEVSTVPVPADYTVGIGRAMSTTGQAALARFLELHSAARPNNQARKAEERTMPEGNGTAPGGASHAQLTEEQRQAEIRIVRDAARADEGKRIENLRQLGSTHGCQDRVDGWIREGKSELEVSREINGVLAERLKKQEPINQSRGVELSDKDFQRFNYGRALLVSDERLMSEYRKDPESAGKRVDTELELEVIREALKNAPSSRSGQGFFIPYVTTKKITEEQQRAIDAGTSTTGAPFKFTQPGDFITLLRNKSSVLRAGLTMINGLTGPLTMPKQTGAGTGNWRADNPGSDNTRADLTTTTVTLSFKTVQASMAMSRQAIFSAASGNYDLEQIVRADLAAVVALAIDLAGLNGLGSNNQPLGILQNGNIGSVTLGANGGTISWNAVVDLESAIGDANAETARMAYITNTKQRGQAKKVAVLGNSATGVPVWGAGIASPDGTIMDGSVNGYRAIASNQVPRNLTKGTATTVCSAWVFGAWEHYMMGSFGSGFDVLADPYSLKNQLLVDLTAWSFVDFALRYDQAVAAVKDAL